MQYNLSYEYCAIALFVIMIIIHLSKKKISLSQNSFFTVVLFSGLLGAAYTALNIYYSENCALFSFDTLYINNIIYFILLASCPFVYSLYSISLTEDNIFKTSWVVKTLIIVPALILIVTLTTNNTTQALFYLDENKVYHQGHYQLIWYAVCFYYTVFGAVYATIYRATTPKKLIFALYSFFIIGSGTSLIQIFFPTQLIQHFGMSVCALLILLTVQKPEEYLDPISGAFNRNTFSKMFAINRKRENQNTLIILFIEDLKLLNNTVGVEKMNSILTLISTYLDKISNDKIFYLNSSTFCIMMDNPNQKELDRVIQSIVNRFNEKFEYETASIYLSTRLMDIRIPEDADSIELVYSYIDYLTENRESKSSIFSAKNITLEPSTRKMDVEKAIRNSISKNSFVMYYQPIYSIAEKRIVSAEALIRLFDPVLGFIPPDEFIRIAEQNGSILQIGEIIFEKVFSFMEKANLHQYGIDYIEVNLSVVQCMQESLATNLLATMKKHNIETSRINLEITETAAINSPKLLLKNMFNLYKNGVSFSLDDFGTGYSNINSLMDLPLNMIKFDKSMIDMATQADKGKIIIGSSVAMVKRMDMKIVGEGIETDEQKRMFEQMGFDYLQGYYFSKPVPGDKFIDFLKEFPNRNV